MSSAGPDGPSPVIVVMGHLVVAPADREAHLARSLPSVVAARAAEGCLHFSVSADPVDPDRVVVAELWRSRADLDRFRAQPDDGDGDPFAAIREFHVRELEVAG